jgi:two-component system response regulator AtoC
LHSDDGCNFLGQIRFQSVWRIGTFIAYRLVMLAVEERPVIEAARRNLSVCVLDEQSNQADLTTARLQKAGFPAVGTTHPEDALQTVRAGACRVVVADVKSPGTDGLKFLEKTLQCDPGMFVVLVTGYYSVDAAIEAIKHGAYDYLCKPVNYERLLKALDDLAERFTQRSQIRDLEDKLLDNLLFHGIVGRSPAMLEVFDLASKIARHYTNVLITGPTGCGKELIARAAPDESGGAGTLRGVQLFGVG